MPKRSRSESVGNRTEERVIPIRELGQYNGEYNSKIYIGLQGKIYDVTSRRDLYGPKGRYKCFAGRDATRALAKLCFDEADLSRGADIEGLEASQLKMLDEWVVKFQSYEVVGVLEYPSKKARSPALARDSVIWEASAVAERHLAAQEEERRAREEQRRRQEGSSALELPVPVPTTWTNAAESTAMTGAEETEGAQASSSSSTSSLSPPPTPP